MSLVEILVTLILVLSAHIIRASILIVPMFGALYILFIIFTDEFLSQHIFISLSITTMSGFTCCLLILSKICQLRRRPSAEHKPMKQLRDSDLLYENESEQEPQYKLSCHWRHLGTTLKNFFFKNPYEFSKFRPVYGLMLLAGLIFASIFATTMKCHKEEMDDVYCVGTKALVPMGLLIFIVYLCSNVGIYSATKSDDLYNPFDEYVQIPMKFLVTKALAILVTGGGVYWFLVLFIFSIMGLSIISSNHLYHDSKIDISLQSILPPIYHGTTQRFLCTVLIVTIVGCVNAIIGMMVLSLIEAKNSFLCILEKNWERNLGAISFLFPDTEFENLQDMKTALDQKRNQPLTEKEEKAIHYISWPIWRTKPPFMLRNFESDSSESESSDRQDPDENDKPEHNQESDTSEEAELKGPAHKDQPSQKAEREAGESAPSEQLHEARESAPSEQLLEARKPVHSEQLREVRKSVPSNQLREAIQSEISERLREARNSKYSEQLRETRISAPSEQLDEAKKSVQLHETVSSETPRKLKELAGSAYVQQKSRLFDQSTSTAK